MTVQPDRPLRRIQRSAWRIVGTSATAVALRLPVAVGPRLIMLSTMGSAVGAAMWAALGTRTMALVAARARPLWSAASRGIGATPFGSLSIDPWTVVAPLTRCARALWALRRSSRSLVGPPTGRRATGAARPVSMWWFHCRQVYPASGRLHRSPRPDDGGRPRLVRYKIGRLRWLARTTSRGLTRTTRTILEYNLIESECASATLCRHFNPSMQPGSDANR